MQFLTDVDGDEVSPVRLAANRRRIVLKEGDVVDNELADIMAVPWEREGALLDEIRKSGVHDESVERAVVAAVRLLKGVESELSPEMIEKLGGELYGRKNPKINTSSVDAEGELVSAGQSGEDQYGSASGAPKDGSGRDGELSGKGSAPKVAADADGDTNEPDDDADDPKKGKKKRRLFNKVSKENDSADNEDVFTTDEEGGTVEVQVPVRKEDGTWDFSGVPSDSRPFFESILEKADATEKELKETREKLEKSDDELRSRTMLAKAATYSHVAPTDDLAPILKAASEKMDPESFEKLTELLGAAEERIAKGDLFTEMGKKATEDGSAPSDAYQTAVQKANEMVEKAEGKLSEDQAMARVWDANPDLYSKYLVESGMGVN